MSRMSREFSLVLLGSGALSVAYFASPSVEARMDEKAVAEAAERVGFEGDTQEEATDANGTSHRRYHGGHFFFVHSFGYAGSPSGRPAAYSPSTRSGGFGSIGRSFSGGS